jgi:hypothetical protein
MTSLQTLKPTAHQLLSDRANGVRSVLLLEVATEFRADEDERGEELDVPVAVATPEAFQGLVNASRAALGGQPVSVSTLVAVMQTPKGKQSEAAFLHKFATGPLALRAAQGPGGGAHPRLEGASLSLGGVRPDIVREFYINFKARPDPLLEVFDRQADGGRVRLAGVQKMGGVEGARVLYLPVAGFRCPVIDALQIDSEGNVDFIQWTEAADHDVKWEWFLQILTLIELGETARWRFVFARPPGASGTPPAALNVTEVREHGADAPKQLRKDCVKDGPFVFFDGYCPGLELSQILLSDAASKALVLDSEYANLMAILA